MLRFQQWSTLRPLLIGTFCAVEKWRLKIPYQSYCYWNRELVDRWLDDVSHNRNSVRSKTSSKAFENNISEEVSIWWYLCPSSSILTLNFPSVVASHSFTVVQFPSSLIAKLIACLILRHIPLFRALIKQFSQHVDTFSWTIIHGICLANFE